MTTTQSWAPVAAPVVDRRGNVPATAGFFFGAAGLVAGFFPVVGLLVTVPAIVLSQAGRARFRTGRASGPGRSTAGLVLGWTGTAVCVLMSVFLIVAAVNAPAVQPAARGAVAPVPAAPALLSVPNVVGMSDRQARDVLAAAGFTQVVLGPSTGPAAGVAAGTVTTQLPGVAALAAAGDPIVLGEAAAPPVPQAPPAPAAPVAPVAEAPAARQAPVPEPGTATGGTTGSATGGATGTDRPYVPAAPQPLVSPGTGSTGGSTGSSASYANCTAARDAGAAPLYRGDPGYAAKLDRDGDGVACE